MAKIYTFIILFLGSFLYATEDSQWLDLNLEVFGLIETGQLDSAQRMAEMALDSATIYMQSDHPHLGIIKTTLGLIHMGLGRYDAADSCIQQGRLIMNNAPSEYDSWNALSLYAWGTILQGRGYYHTADSAYDKALSLAEKDSDIYPFLKHSAHFNQSMIDLARGDTVTAVDNFKRLLSDLDKTSVHYIDVLKMSCYVLLGDVEKERGGYRTADSLYRMAFDISNSFLIGALWEESIRTRWGLLFEEMEDFPAAEFQLRKTLDLQLKKYDLLHPSVEKTLRHLSLVYDHQGKFKQADSLYEKLLTIFSQFPSYAQSSSGFHMKPAAEYHPQIPQVIRHSLDIRKKVLHENSPAVIEALYRVGVMYAGQHKRAQADSLFELTLELQEKALGRGHPDLVRTLISLADLYLKYDAGFPDSERFSFEVTEGYLLRALDIQQRLSGSMHPDLLPVYKRMRRLYRRDEKTEKIEEMNKAIEKIRSDHSQD